MSRPGYRVIGDLCFVCNLGCSSSVSFTYFPWVVVCAENILQFVFSFLFFLNLFIHEREREREKERGRDRQREKQVHRTEPGAGLNLGPRDPKADT